MAALRVGLTGLRKMSAFKGPGGGGSGRTSSPLFSPQPPPPTELAGAQL